MGRGTYERGGAFSTFFWVDPENDLLFVGMMNRQRSRTETRPPEGIAQEMVYRALKRDNHRFEALSNGCRTFVQEMQYSSVHIINAESKRGWLSRTWQALGNTPASFIACIAGTEESLWPQSGAASSKSDARDE